MIPINAAKFTPALKFPISTFDTKKARTMFWYWVISAVRRLPT